MEQFPHKGFNDDFNTVTIHFAPPYFASIAMIKCPPRDSNPTCSNFKFDVSCRWTTWA